MTDESLFTEALARTDPAARAEYLAAACPSAEQRARVEALLAAHAAAGGFLEMDRTPPPDTEAYHSGPGAADADADPIGPLAPSPRPGALGRIGHYDVLEVLGRGGFGTVYRAIDDTLQRVVAVKVLAPRLAAASPARKRFLREARASASVRHENVVQVHAVKEEPLPYLVMEFIPGETLQQRIARTGPLDVPEVLRVGRQIAEGLAAAHARGLVHRDVKPANVLIESGPQQKVKLTDFGLARTADDASASQSGVVAGTPQYMSPEQARGEALDHRTDLFSLGSVLYALCTGRPPFRASGTLAVLKRVTDEDPRPIREVIPEVPEWLCRVVTKLLAKSPDERFQTAREVADLLASCERHVRAHGALSDPDVPLPLHPEAAAPPPAGPGPARGGRARRAGAAAVLLAACAAAAAYRSPIELFVTNRGEVVLDHADPGIEVTVRQNGIDLVERSARRAFRVEAGVPVELRFFVGGRAGEVFRADADVPRGGRARVNVAAELAAAEGRARAGAASARGAGGTAAHEGPNPGPARAAPPEAPAVPFDRAKAERLQREWGAFLGLKGPAFTEPRTGMEFRVIPPGDFQMGLPSEEVRAEVERAQAEMGGGWQPYVRSMRAQGPRHPVRLTRPFAIGTCEVTVAQFRKFVTAQPNGYRTEVEQKGGFGFANGTLGAGPGFKWDNVGYTQADNSPVWNVSHGDAVAFCKWLSAETGRTFRLPTEAEWEWACRAGTDTRTYWDGEKFREVYRYAWVSWKSDGKPQPVGQLRANAFGLHDMCGNVWEWCSDWYGEDYYRHAPAVDPPGPLEPTPGKPTHRRVRRGGGTDTTSHALTSAARPIGEHKLVGFRVVCEIAGDFRLPPPPEAKNPAAPPAADKRPVERPTPEPLPPPAKPRT